MGRGKNIESEYKKIFSFDTGTEVGHSNSKPDEEEEVRTLVEFMEDDLKQAPSSPPNYTIYRILKPLREVKPEAYTPRLVSIGPFHRHNIHLWPMEAHKLRLLKYFLNRSHSVSLADYVREMRNLEEEARQCYSEVIPFKKEEFVRMIVVDGCFLLELILGWKNLELRDPIFNESWMPQIVRDIMLLENQLPFLVLQRLYLLSIRDSSNREGTIYDVTQEFLHDFLPHSPSIIHKAPISQRFCAWVKSIFHAPSELKKDRGELPEESPSILPSQLEMKIDQEEFPESQVPEESPSILPSQLEMKIDQEEFPESQVPEESPSILPSQLEMNIDQEEFPESQVPEGGVRHLLDYVRHLFVSELSKEDEKMQYSVQAHCATELKKATVKFKRSKTTCFSDITFKDGVLRIPAINIDDLTESLLRNLIALEQYHQYQAKYVTAYAVFMEDLINSPEDVELLQAEGIFESLINAEDVAALFNKLLREVTQPQDLCFSQVYNELELFYISPWHKFVAKVQQHLGSLKRKYFKNTWSFISFLAATALLGLTIAQTIAAFKYNSKSGY